MNYTEQKRKRKWTEPIAIAVLIELKGIKLKSNNRLWFGILVGDRVGTVKCVKLQDKKLVWVERLLNINRQMKDPSWCPRATEVYIKSAINIISYSVSESNTNNILIKITNNNDDHDNDNTY